MLDVDKFHRKIEHFLVLGFSQFVGVSSFLISVGNS